MAAELNPNAQEYYPSSFLPPTTHHLIHLPCYEISSYSNILRYPPLPPSISCNPAYFFTSPDTSTPAYPYELPPPSNPNVFPADFLVGYYTTTQHTSAHPYCPKYYPNVNFSDMGLDYYHHSQQTRIPPPSLPLVSSYSSSPVMNQIRVLEELNNTDETDYHHQQAITVAAIASDYDDLVGNKESYEKKQSSPISLSPPYEQGSGSSSSSRKIWNKGFNGKPAESIFYRKNNNSLGSTAHQHHYPGMKNYNRKSKSPFMMYSMVKNREDDEVEPVQQNSNKTTVMIKNIPNQYTKMLIEFLDKHCQSENEKAKLSSTDKESLLTLLSAYDFVYLPIDFCTDANKGYAFVNFTNPTAAWKLNSFLNKYEWNVLNTKKIARVTYARRQGKEELVNYFEGTEFYCDSDELLPICFVPYRDGCEKEMVKQSIVGKCIGYRKECYHHWCRCHSARNQKNV